MDQPKKFEIAELQLEERRKRNITDKNMLVRSEWPSRVTHMSLSILILVILPENILTADYECGINRFNNESPLTERIVGGNNSLQ